MRDESPAGPAPIPIEISIAPRAKDKAAWLVDIWGVMHNGLVPFAEAGEACTRFRAAGGVVVLLSNAPRPAASVAAQLDKIGVERSAWDEIISSGDAARAFLADLGGVPLLHIGPERDLGIYAGLDVQLVDAAAAKAIVCTGLFDDETETAEDYLDLLGDLARRDLPMICANPDISVERGTRIIPCAGALAVAYEGLGGSVKYAGKPHRPVYDMALEAIGRRLGRDIGEAEVLAIGDGIRTDIAGAANAGIESVFIASGVHVRGAGSLDAAALAEIFRDPSPRPVAAMRALTW